MEDFDKLMWGDFDYKNRDFPEEATERMNEQRFAREYTVYKMGDLVNKIITLDKKFELPFNSILHVLDNVSYPDNYQDAPRVDENEFIQRESGRKFIYHIRELDTTGPIVYPDKFILRFAGLPTTLMKFRQQQGSNFRYLNKIEEFPTNNLYLIVVNHNPLFRMRMYGRLPYFRIMQQILASVFNTCDKLKYQHRHQFILLPWSSEVYDKSLFIRSRKELTPSTVRKPNSFHFIFMMHLVNFLWEKETTSMLEKLDDETLAQINIILKHNDKYLIFNLKKIKDFNAKNIIYYRFVNQLNLLALMGSEEAEKHQDTINQLIEENKSETENTTFEIKSPEDKTELDEVHQDTVINKLVSVIKPKKEIAPVRAAAAIKTYVPQPKEVMREVKPSGEQVIRRVAIINKIANVSTISTKETKDTYAEEYVKDLDTETIDFIDNNEDLTPAAKQHFKKLAAKYKECKVDGVYISKLLLDHSDIGLEKEVLDEKVVGFAPDKSALESSADTFEKSYREKTFKKHFAGVISSFQNKGVFLTDVKQEVVADPLNNYTLYTCSYEDIHSKKSTIKIKIPNIDSNDRFIADGNPMVIKKQRCALPIIKINDHEVALSSNYNKTRVVRNTTKAHSFTGYVESFVNNKDKSTANIIFGSLDINEPISYEYCMMAKRFNEITFTNKDKFVLVFDYYHRFNHVKPSQVSPEKVEKLENNYGTFFGYNTNDIFFIDNTNQVFAVNKKNFSEDVDFPYTSLLDLLKLSLRDGIEVKKALSEFLTIKILNAELPVMIMLAYRYGLRRMLDYIGIEYYITENRSKTIVGENTIEGTESFDVKASLARVQYLNELNKSSIDKNKIIIGASAALVAYGLLDTPNKDLDISIEDNYKKTLINKGVLVRNTEDGATHWVVSNTHIDAGVDGPDQQKFSYTELKKLGITIINGYTFISLEGMIKFYEKCKELFPNDKEKQQKYNDRIALIEQALASTAGTESFGVNSDRVAGSDELEILYGKDWIKPRNDSKPNIVITNRRAEQDETDYEILQNDRNKNDLTYSLPGAEDLKIKWFKSYGTCKSAITWQHLSSAELIALFQDPNPEYLESEKDLRSYVKQIIKKYDKGDLFPYYDTSWFAEVTRKYHLTSEDSKIDNKFDGRGNNFCCSGNTIYSWEFMFAGLPDAFSENYIKAMRECAFGKIFINCRLDNMIKAIKAGRKIPKKYIEMKYFSVIMHERGHAYTPYNVYAKDVENGIIDIEKQEIYANMYAIPLIRAKLKELGLPTVLIASQNPALQQAREAVKSSNTRGTITDLIVSWPEKIDVGVGLEKFNKYITDGFDTKVANYPDISKFINKDVYVKKIENKLGLIDSLVDSITRSTVFESIKSVFGLEGLDGVEDLKILREDGSTKILWQHLNAGMCIALIADPNPEYLNTDDEATEYARSIIKKYDRNGDLFLITDNTWAKEVCQKYHLDKHPDAVFRGKRTYCSYSGGTILLYERLFEALPDVFYENYRKACRECAFGRIFIIFDPAEFRKLFNIKKFSKKFIEVAMFTAIMHERGHTFTPMKYFDKIFDKGVFDQTYTEAYANMYAIPKVREKLEELGLPTKITKEQCISAYVNEKHNIPYLKSMPDIDVGIGISKFNKYITDGYDVNVPNYPDVSKYLNKHVSVKNQFSINTITSIFNSPLNVVSGVFDKVKSVFGLEGLDRPVKPRLGKIHFYITVTSTGDELNPSAVKIRGMLIEVKLGQSHAVMRRVLNYDGITFRTQDPQKLSKSILEKASDYLHCTEHKIKSADITVIPNAAPLPQDVAKARPMTAEEYAKVTSKLNNEETRVGGNESFDEPMISSEKRYEPKPNDIHIKFADRVLHFNRYPLDKSLIVAGLDAYDLTGYSMADFEGKDAYFSLFAENGLAVNYLKGIDSFYDLFVDNMTYTVLKQMHEPTNVRDLLLRCGVLLSTIDHKEASSGANHRIRGYEQFNAILYNEMSREFAGYQARRSKNNAFSINPKAVYLRIVQNESTMPAEASNPLEDIKMYSNITYGGIGGRTGESFVTNDRRFAADDIGVLSEATADSGKVGMNAMLSFDPTVVNTLGVCESKDPHTLKPANVMSIHSLCMPFANTDDPPRVNFNSIQSTHLMGTEYVNKNRVRTGYERVVAHRVSDDFAAVAEKDGKVTKIDHEAKLMEVTYNDGTRNVFRIDDQYEYAESIVIQQNLVTNFKVGDKFKKQDVLTYNKNFFTRDNFTGQADYTTGVMANVVFIETETTLEDSTEISEALSKKLAIDPVNPKVITLSAKSKVYKALSIGDKVEVSTPLMVFEEDPVGDDNGLTVDESTVELLGDLNRATPTAGYSGEIVHIDAYYGGSISNMNPSVAKLVNAAIAEVNAASKLASGSMRANEFIKSTQVPIGSKFKGIEFDEDTVMFIYYIKERIPHSTGDKLVLCNQLKATTAAIFPKPIQTESGVPIDMFFSQRGVNARKCLSPFLNGIISRIIEKTEKNIIKDYFG